MCQKRSEDGRDDPILDSTLPGFLARSRLYFLILDRALARSTPDEADGIESQSGLGEELEEFVPMGGEFLDLG